MITINSFTVTPKVTHLKNIQKQYFSSAKRVILCQVDKVITAKRFWKFTESFITKEQLRIVYFYEAALPILNINFPQQWDDISLTKTNAIQN